MLRMAALGLLLLAFTLSSAPGASAGPPRARTLKLNLSADTDAGRSLLKLLSGIQEPESSTVGRDTQQLLSQLEHGDPKDNAGQLRKFIDTNGPALSPEARTALQRFRPAGGGEPAGDLFTQMRKTYQPSGELLESLRYLNSRQSARPNHLPLPKLPSDLSFGNGQIYRVGQGKPFQVVTDHKSSPPVQVHLHHPTDIDASTIKEVALTKNSQGEFHAVQTPDGEKHDFGPLVKWTRAVRKSDLDAVQDKHAANEEAAGQESNESYHQMVEDLKAEEKKRSSKAIATRTSWKDGDDERFKTNWNKMLKEQFNAPTLLDAQDVWRDPEHAKTIANALPRPNTSLRKQLHVHYLSSRDNEALEEERERFEASPEKYHPMVPHLLKNIMESRNDRDRRVRAIWEAARNSKARPKKIDRLMREHSEQRPNSPFAGKRRLATWKLFAESQGPNRMNGFTSKDLQDPHFHTAIALARQGESTPWLKAHRHSTFHEHKLVDDLARLQEGKGFSNADTWAELERMDHEHGMHALNSVLQSEKQYLEAAKKHEQSMERKSQSASKHKDTRTSPEDLHKIQGTSLTPEEQQQRQEEREAREARRRERSTAQAAEEKAERRRNKQKLSQLQQERATARKEREAAKRQKENQRLMDKKTKQREAARQRGQEREKALKEEQEEQEQRERLATEEHHKRKQNERAQAAAAKWEQEDEEQHKPGPIALLTSHKAQKFRESKVQRDASRPVSPEYPYHADLMRLLDDPVAGQKHPWQGDGQTKPARKVNGMVSSVKENGPSLKEVGLLLHQEHEKRSRQALDALTESQKLHNTQESYRQHRELYHLEASSKSAKPGGTYLHALQGGSFDPRSSPYQTFTNDLRFPHPLRLSTDVSAEPSTAKQATSAPGKSEPLRLTDIMQEQQMEARTKRQQDITTLKAHGRWAKQDVGNRNGKAGRPIVLSSRRKGGSARPITILQRPKKKRNQAKSATTSGNDAAPANGLQQPDSKAPVASSDQAPQPQQLAPGPPSQQSPASHDMAGSSSRPQRSNPSLSSNARSNPGPDPPRMSSLLSPQERAGHRSYVLQHYDELFHPTETAHVGWAGRQQFVEGLSDEALLQRAHQGQNWQRLTVAQHLDKLVPPTTFASNHPVLRAQFVAHMPQPLLDHLSQQALLNGYAHAPSSAS